jgi:hypothetical protein
MGGDRPVKPYSEVKSEWIKQEITERDFENQEDRDFVDTLVYIEKMVLEGPTGFASGMQWGQVRNKHPKKYDRIQKELRPEKYAERKRREAENERQLEDFQDEQQNKKEEAKREAREEWQQIKESE